MAYHGDLGNKKNEPSDNGSSDFDLLCTFDHPLGDQVEGRSPNPHALATLRVTDAQVIAPSPQILSFASHAPQL